MAAAAEDGHGRHEERHVTVPRNPTGLPEGWADVAAGPVAGRERAVGGRNASTVHYYATRPRCPAKRLAGYVRGHWGGEDGRHGCLDVSFGADGTGRATGTPVRTWGWCAGSRPRS